MISSPSLAWLSLNIRDCSTVLKLFGVHTHTRTPEDGTLLPCRLRQIKKVLASTSSFSLFSRFYVPTSRSEFIFSPFCLLSPGGCYRHRDSPWAAAATVYSLHFRWRTLRRSLRCEAFLFFFFLNPAEIVKSWHGRSVLFLKLFLFFFVSWPRPSPLRKLRGLISMRIMCCVCFCVCERARAPFLHWGPWGSCSCQHVPWQTLHDDLVQESAHPPASFSPFIL
jgi:hypothetical protein